MFVDDTQFAVFPCIAYAVDEGHEEALGHEAAAAGDEGAVEHLLEFVRAEICHCVEGGLQRFVRGKWLRGVQPGAGKWGDVADLCARHEPAQLLIGELDDAADGVACPAGAAEQFRRPGDFLVRIVAAGFTAARGHRGIPFLPCTDEVHGQPGEWAADLIETPGSAMWKVARG